MYDPFERGGYPVGVRTVQAIDRDRDRRFPCEIWYPAAPAYSGRDIDPATRDCFPGSVDNMPRNQPAVRDADAQAGTYPLILFSHSSGGDRRQSAFLCTHLSSHGYLVAALDHSERVVEALMPRDGESEKQRGKRLEAVIASRVPDIRFLLGYLLERDWDPLITIDLEQIGIVGHSFGGWTALAAIDFEPRIRAVAALAPAGSSIRKPGVLPVELSFDWRRDVPVLYLVAENDTSLPLEGMYELFERTPATRRMLILRRSDHLHFMDEYETLHESFRTMSLSGELAEIQKEMLPASNLCSPEKARLFTSSLVVCHFDGYLKDQQGALQFLDEQLNEKLVLHGIDAIGYF